jgi:hypothetical protein
MLDDRTFHHPDAAAPAPSLLARAARNADRLTTAAAALILLGGAGVVLSSLSARIAQLEAAARATAPIAVIDYAPVLEGLSAGAPREALEAAFAGVKALAEERVAAGHVVINASFVEGAPERFRVSVPPEAERELRAAIAAARSLASSEGLFAGPALGVRGTQVPAPPPAGLGAGMTPEEARALIGAQRLGPVSEGLR